MYERMPKDKLLSPRKPIALITLFLLVFAFPTAKDLLFAQAKEKEKIVVEHIILEDYEGKHLSHPSGLFHDSFRRETYVVDSGNNRILIYAYDFFHLLSIAKTDGINYPVAVTLDSEGNLFITQSSTKKYPRGRLSVLNANLRWERDILFEDFEGADKFTPYNIVYHKDGFLYVTGKDYPGVVVLDKNGHFSRLLTPVDSFAGKTKKALIRDVEIDDFGKIYLLSQEMGRIYVYDTQGNFLLKFGKKGGGPGKFSRPNGLAVDSHRKRVYVVDYMRHTILVYSMEGKFLFEFGGLGWAKGWVQFPSDICTDREGKILVADTFNNRVQVFKTVPLRQ